MANVCLAVGLCVTEVQLLKERCLASAGGLAVRPTSSTALPTASQNICVVLCPAVYVVLLARVLPVFPQHNNQGGVSVRDEAATARAE